MVWQTPSSPYNFLTTSLFVASALAFGHVPGSPCTSVCSGNSSATLENDVVCFNDNFFSNSEGIAFRDCVACELNSTAVDSSKNQTDVEWGLFNIRYTLSECMFGFPEERISISNPCVVTCEPLADAVGYQLSNNTLDANPDLSFCTANVFDDHDINNCAFCYGLIPEQLFLANFMQALHVACLQPPAPGSPFFPDAETLFNQSVIPNPSSPSSPSSNSSSGIHGWRLAVAIAVPVVGGVLILCAACFCCFLYTRRRRKRMSDTGRMSRLRDSWQGAAEYMDGPVDGPVEDQEQEMQRISPKWATYQQQGEQPGAMRGSPALPTESVGPGAGQVQDHNLHEQYFGTPTHPVYPTDESEIGLATTSPIDPRMYREEYQDDREVVAGPSGTRFVSPEEHAWQTRQERGDFI